MAKPWSSRPTTADWLEKPKPVRATSSFRVAAPYEQVVALLRRPDVALLQPGVRDVVPVPSTSLVILVHQRPDGAGLEAVDLLPVTGPTASTWQSPRTGTTTAIDVEPAGRGARVTLRLEHRPEPRAVARNWQNHLELTLSEWRDRLTVVVTGFQPFPVGQPQLVRHVQPPLPALTAHLVGERVLQPPPAEVWHALTSQGRDAEGAVRFGSGPQGPAVGDLRWAVRAAESDVQAAVSEVVAVVPLRMLALRPLAAPAHPSLTSWRLEGVTGGTRLTYDHECATSHAGTGDDATAALDLAEAWLRLR